MAKGMWLSEAAAADPNRASKKMAGISLQEGKAKLF